MQVEKLLRNEQELGVLDIFVFILKIPACPASWIQGYFFLKDMTNGDQWTMFFIFFQDLCCTHTHTHCNFSDPP